MNKCVNCGFENDEKGEVCVNCGSQLSFDVSKATQDKKSSKLASNIKHIITNPRIIKICLAALTISILAIVFFSYQAALFRYEKSVYSVDILMLVFWSTMAFVSIAVLITVLIMKIKDKK